MTVTYRALWRWHFHAGMFCIPFVIVLALTGSIYLFKPQLDAFADRDVDSLTLTGHPATAEAQIAAAIASLPGSKLFTYEIPREADDAVRVHLYSPDGTGRIVYVHPESLAILKTVPHTARLTEVVKTIHGELLAGRTGSILVELAASWAVIMFATGLYLWWPRETRGLAGVLYPRLHDGRRVFWRDLHAVAGIWISTLAIVPADHRAAVDTDLGRGLQGTAYPGHAGTPAGLERRSFHGARRPPARHGRPLARLAARARSARATRGGAAPRSPGARLSTVGSPASVPRAQ